ncbi:E-selectin-like [Styela clava]
MLLYSQKILVSILFVSVGTVTGIKCWTCDNAESLEMCNNQGKLTQCNSAQTSCGIEVRGLGSTERMNIYKFCKQETACLNMLDQNSGTLPNCNPFPNNVCRCCCLRDGCNSRTLDCLRHVVPQCDEKPSVPINGFVICSDATNIGSVCTFGCEEGYVIMGPTTITCINVQQNGGSPVWSQGPPICKQTQCGTVPPSPVNGEVFCNGNIIGSKCDFVCNNEYFRVGRKSVTCIDNEEDSDPKWNGKTPICYKQKCDAVLWAPTNGFMKCSNERFVGSICSFRCDYRYDLVGHRKSTCIINSSIKQVQWRNKQPKCIRKLCISMPATPENGQMFCSDKRYYGSVCAFRCDEGYQRNGPSHTKCISKNKLVDEEPQWNLETPVCNKAGCPEIRLQYGITTCSDENRIGSICKFTCTSKEYERYPESRNTISCQNNSNWSEEPPCCARKCPPYNLMDLVILLDSSSSIGKRNWKKMISFVDTVVDLFAVQNDSVNFGIIRYNAEIDVKTKIDLNKSPKNATRLKELIAKIPYNGKGTRTGEAMTYVQENMFSYGRGDRPNARNVLLDITDGKSQDDITEPLRILKKNGISTYVIAVTSVLSAFDEIWFNGTDNEHLYTVGSFADLTREYAEEISLNLCGDPCEATNN